MASVGHVAVGVAAARSYRDGRLAGWRSMAFWSAVSLLPDVDVIGFSLGVPYGAPWGLFWPVDRTRYFAPWQPIPVAPIGAAFLSPRGLFVSITELALFAPFLFYALRPARVGTRSIVVFVTLWLAGGWLVASDDPVRERVIATVLRSDTAYTSRYSDALFRGIAAGQSQQQVRDALGSPFSESWFYPTGGERAAGVPATALDGCRAVRLEREVVVSALAPEACRHLGIVAGTPRRDAAHVLGPAPESCWQYSWSPSASHYRARGVCFVGATVDSVTRGWR